MVVFSGCWWVVCGDRCFPCVVLGFVVVGVLGCFWLVYIVRFVVLILIWCLFGF